MSEQERHIVPEPLPYRKNMLWNSAGSIVYLGCQWLITVLVVRLTVGYDAAGLLSLLAAWFIDSVFAFIHKQGGIL